MSIYCERCDKLGFEFCQCKKSKRGGYRPGAGRPPKEGPKREKHSPTLAPGTKELAQAIAKEQGWDGWGYAVDEGIRLLAEKLNLKK
jgi:hypothetical protein